MLWKVQQSLSYQQDTSCALQLLHGGVQITVSHMREFLHPTVDKETPEAGYDVCSFQLVNTLGPFTPTQCHKKYCSLYLYCLYLHSKLRRNMNMLQRKSQ